MKTKNLLVVLASSTLLLSACGGKGGGGGNGDHTDVDLPTFERTTYTPFNGALNLTLGHGETKEEAAANVAAGYRASLGALERWSVEHYTTGLTLYDDTSYIMYHPSVEKGTQTYVPSYGFGIQREGNITADLEGEENSTYKRYYHSLLSADPNTLKYMDSKEQTVGTLAGEIAATLWTTHLNASKDDYVWAPELAKDEEPVALTDGGEVDPTATQAKKYRVEVKVGDEWKYNTNSAKPAVAAYNGRGIALEDYVTPYKIYYTKAFGLKRSTENLTGSGAFKGTQEYYDASGDDFNETAWANVGISCAVEGEHNYLYFEFQKATSIEDAKAYLSSSMMNPVPMEFIKDTLGGGDLKAGVKLWGNYSQDYTSYTPLDTALSTGPYTVEHWEKEKLITFKRNPFYPQYDAIYDEVTDTTTNREIYRIPGLHYTVFPAMKADPNAAFNEFLANKTHACSIPSDYLTEYLSDPRTTVVEGTSTFRLNFNACDQEFWIKNFGEDGIAYQNPTSDYWVCEPIMSNDYFLRGLSYAVDRLTLAGSIGAGPFVNFLSNAYTLGEKGDIWNYTDEHKAAVISLTQGTDGYGYNLSFAKECFKRACEQLIEEGTYAAGDTISLEVRWYASSQFETEGAPVKQMIETAFNNCGGGLTLSINNVADDSDPYSVFDYIEKGQFDIAIGGISGMEYWPLEFCQTLKSNNETGYTLNFGADTSLCDGTLAIPLSQDQTTGEWYYDAEGTMYSFSFDALFNANYSGAFILGGELAPLNWEYLGIESVENIDGSVTSTIAIYVEEETDPYVELNSIYFYYRDGETAYQEFELEENVDYTISKDSSTGVWTFTITISSTAYEEVYPLWTLGEDYESYTGFDFYFDWYKGGEKVAEGVYDTSLYFVPAPAEGEGGND